MITNGKITIYHKNFDCKNKIEKWQGYIYDVWFYGGKGASINKGYDNANDIDIRIPYEKNPGLNVNNFSIGDIIVSCELKKHIKTQKELNEYETYNITSIINNTFGNNIHIHLGGK